MMDEPDNANGEMEPEMDSISVNSGREMSGESESSDEMGGDVIWDQSQVESNKQTSDFCHATSDGSTYHHFEEDLSNDVEVARCNETDQIYRRNIPDDINEETASVDCELLNTPINGAHFGGDVTSTSTNPQTLGGRRSLDPSPNSTNAAWKTSHVAKQIEACLLNSEENLELSQRALSKIPTTLFRLQHLKNLYLEGNELRDLPENFFPRLENLRWLDLRNNRLEYLPRNVGEHCNLSTILLEGNRLQTLPPELGLLRNLRGLNVRNNPLKDPPQEILKLGFKKVMHYLRQHVLVYNEDENDDDIFCIRSRFKSTRPSRYHMSRRANSSFRSAELTKKLGLIPYELGTKYLGPSSEFLKARADRDNENHLTKLRQDQINAFVQHMKSEMALKSWRHKAQLEQMETSSSGGSRSASDITLKPPYATDENFLVMMSRIQLQNMECGKSLKKFPKPMPGFIDASRRKREKDLEHQIWMLLEKLQTSSQSGSVELQEAAAQLTEVERLQRELSSLFRTIL